MYPKIICAILFLSSTLAWAGDGKIHRVGRPIGNQYIVTLSGPLSADRVADMTADLLAKFGGKAITTYSLLFKGFAANLTEPQAIALSVNPLVSRVEEDGLMTLQSSQTISSAQLYPPPPTTNASLWFLDRIDSTSPTQRLDGLYSYCSDGTGVRAYVVDTGVLPQHAEFGGRVDPAPALQTYTGNAGFPSLGDQCWVSGAALNGFSAANAHGTAVASVIGGATVGVAKNVTIVDARFLHCDGENDITGPHGEVSRLAKTLEWIPQDPNRGSAQAVVNISSAIDSVDDPNGAIASSIATLVDTYHIPLTAAAGNFNSNVFWYTPADAARAIAVAGTNKNSDDRWAYSNYGNTTAFYAPAQFIESASTYIQAFFPSSLTRDKWRSELDDCTNATLYPNDTCTSGTSFSAPIVAGVIARYLQNHPGSTRDQIVSALQSQAKVYVNDPVLGPMPLINLVDCP